MNDENSIFGADPDRLRELVRSGMEADDVDGQGDVPATRSADSLIERPGTRIGRYELLRVLGEGGMGVVYLAHDTKLDRSVAIKSLPSELTRNAKMRSRLRREAKLLASLDHPNIAIIHDLVEQTFSGGYLILEYVKGDTLAERISHGPLDQHEALAIAQQIAEAVAAAHEHNVIHRDLKPGNIKITPEGKVKVLDFGLAKVIGVEATNQQSTLTESGRVVGTPAYMSPEQARGQPTDRRADIWSFGCVLYEMLTGRVPFEGETASDTIANILQTDPDWQVLPQALPASIQLLLRRCLEKDARCRLRDIGDAAIELRETLSLPPAAPSPTMFAKSRRIEMIIGATVVVILSCIAVWFISKLQTPPSPKEIRLVVLPFENLGPIDDQYFADGITDAITARLAGIHGLGVISRQSAMQYKTREKTPQIIREELSVDYILDGTVQRERSSDRTSRVRITPQLIRTSDDRNVWAQVYDSSMSEVFQLQSDLAEQVAQALDIALLEPERQALRARPTENMEAYEYYLRGNEYFQRGYLQDDIRIAIQMYEKAVELDPTFCLAYTQLSLAHVDMYWYHYPRSEEHLSMAKKAVDEAFRLNPDLAEVYIALGWYYYHGDLDFDRALEHFATARKSQPNNSKLLEGIACVQRRQGEFKQALTNYRRASELDPHTNSLVFEVAQTCMFLRMYSEAEPCYERAISLRPDWPEPYSWKAWLYLLWEGRTEKAQVVFEQASQNSESSEDHWIVFRSVVLSIFDGDYQRGLDRLSSYELAAFDTQFWFVPKAQLCAQISRLMGNQQLEEDYYESARRILETKTQGQPEDARFHSALGIAYAGLGRKHDAIREGELAVELLPVGKEALRGFYRAKDLAQIYAMVGEDDAAIDQIEFLLSIPGELSTALLRLDPVWDPLRDHPRFKKLMKTGR